MGLLILTPRICHIPEQSGFRHTQTKNESRRTLCMDCGALQAVGVRVMLPLFIQERNSHPGRKGPSIEMDLFLHI